MPHFPYLDSIKSASKLIVAVGKNKFYIQKADGLAQNYIANALVSFGAGLPSKVAQLVNNPDFNVQNNLTELLLSQEELLAYIQEIDVHFFDQFNFFSLQGIPGSVGEVHRGTLKNGQEVAIKIQYPNIEQTIHNQLTKLIQTASLVTKFSFKKFDNYEFGLYFREKLKEETDYLSEVDNQNEFYNYFLNYSDFIIPKVYKTLSTSKILVQDWIDFTCFNQISDVNLQLRTLLARDLFHFFLISFFKLNKIQGDFHFGNIGVSKQSPIKLVLLDFGSILNLNPDHVKIIGQIIYALRNDISFDALECFHRLGFQKNALQPIEGLLPNLFEIFLRPFCIKSTFIPSQWNFKQESQLLLGKHRMLFRLAGPPWFLMLMKTFYGFMNCLSKLSDQVETSKLMERFLKDLNFNFDLPKVTVQDMSQSIKSKFLCVQVCEDKIEKVYLELPAASCENLEDLIPYDAKEKLISLGYKIEKMKEKIFLSDLIPQNIFELKLSNRYIKVWLE